MRRKAVPKLIGLIFAMILLQGSACEPRTGEWQSMGRTVEIDPATGDTIITQYWGYGTERVATFKRIPKGNTDRRGEPLPPATPPGD